MDVHIKRVQLAIPATGLISILSVTDKQFSNIKNFYGKVEKPILETPLQLELF